MPESEIYPAVGCRLPDTPLKGRDYTRTGAPCHVEPRNTISGTGGPQPASLRPADDRKEANTLLPEPGALFARSKGHVCLGPSPRP